MLSGTSLCNDAMFSHSLSEQCLTNSVVDLVCACVIQVFALQLDISAYFR